MSFTIAILGRPNVGKSTLFNRLVGRREALVHDRPGVTRDRREGEGRHGELAFRVIDTPGLEEAPEESLQGRMRRQTEAALAEADLVLFMIDARAGVTPMDEAFAELVRVAGKKVALVANKAEGRAAEAGVLEAYSLGFGEPIELSAEHVLSLPDLYDVIAETAEELRQAEEAEPEEEADRPLHLAIIGRPNVGKSTLVNRLIGEERVLTGPEAGITRDAIAVDWSWRGRPFRLVDTAGLRRKARVVDQVEQLSAGDALRAVRYAEVAVLVMDATMALEKQDLQIADMVAEEGRALVLALNKWDLVADRAARLREMEEALEETLAQVRGVPLVPISAKTGSGLDRLMETVLTVYETWNRRVPTAKLNDWLADMVGRHPPPAVAGRRIRVKYISQTKTRPPTFYLSCSQPKALPDAYRRYLVNGLRETFGLEGVPIRLMLRRERNPYEGRKAADRRR
jgi:GTPase